VGDFNADGLTDIASANGVSVYVNLSTGTGFKSQTWPVTGKWGLPAYSWGGDFNGDGKTDLASANGVSVCVSLSTGTGFTSQTWPVTGTWGLPGYTWVGDFNQDGKADIASANGGSVYMSLSTGTGFTSQTWPVANKWGAPGFTRSGDFNADGAPDIASASGGIIYVNISTGAGFSSQAWPVANTWGTPAATWAGDFNGDGYDDLASLAGPQTYLFLSHGGRFASQTWNTSQPGNVAGRAGGHYAGAKAASPKRMAPADPLLFKCDTTYSVNQWSQNFDLRRSLSYSMTLDQLGFTKVLTKGSPLSSDDDGLYIFVLHRDTASGKPVASLRIRRSDRTDDVGFGVQGDHQYLYAGNIPCPNQNPRCDCWSGEKPESPHQFVRHTQLNGGLAPVLAAGQLQIRNGEIIWASNASGHFAPKQECLSCLAQYLDVAGLPRAKIRFERNQAWTDWTENKHDEL
jgi:hypothetical protein